MIDYYDDEESRTAEEEEWAHAAYDEEVRLQKQEAIEKILGTYPGDDEKYRLTFEQAEELVNRGLLDLNAQHHRGATHASIIELLEKHRDLRATGIHASNGGLILDGFDVESENIFGRDLIRDFFEFAYKYSDDFAVSPVQLYMWFD
jgi:hypothetical protein